MKPIGRLRLRSSSLASSLTATFLGLALISASACKNRITETATVESIPANPSSENKISSKTFAVCSDAGYEGKKHLEIEKETSGNKATLISSPEPTGGETISDNLRSTVSGTYDSRQDGKAYEHLFTFGELKFIVTMVPTKLGFYPGTLAGKDDDGKTVSLNVLCSVL
jgi:hypothetical protein